MKTMHLFAGIGGGILADLILGHEPIIAVEWDKYACRVLRERVADGWFPNMHVWEGDVRLFNSSEYEGRVDCIHAGFPCQDISVAGKQAGVGKETRSGLYREVLRIADAIRPKYIFLENVSAILSNGLGTVLGDLSERGYSAQWLCLRASDVGANHQRDRWWLLAYSESKRIGREERDIPKENGRQDGQMRVEPFCPSKESENLASHDTNTNCINRGCEPQITKQEQRECAERESGGICADVSYTELRRREEQRGKMSPSEYADSGWWSVESNIRRVDDGVPDRVGKLKGLGNAQVPLQSAVAFRLLMERI